MRKWLCPHLLSNKIYCMCSYYNPSQSYPALCLYFLIFLVFCCAQDVTGHQQCWRKKAFVESHSQVVKYWHFVQPEPSMFGGLGMRLNYMWEWGLIRFDRGPAWHTFLRNEPSFLQISEKSTDEQITTNQTTKCNVKWCKWWFTIWEKIVCSWRHNHSETVWEN